MTREKKFVVRFFTWTFVVLVGFVLCLFFTKTGSNNPDFTTAATVALWIIGAMVIMYRFDTKRPKGAVPKRKEA